MISRTEAERIAAAIHCLRSDWPVSSLVTLIIRDCSDWALRDLASALAWVAVDQDADGTYISNTPARVTQNGPWRNIGTPEERAARERYRRDAQARRDAIRLRKQAVDACPWCDQHGRLDGDVICHHDQPPQQRAQVAASRVAAARAEVRPTIRYQTGDQT